MPRRPITTPFHRLPDGGRRAFVLTTGLSLVVAALLIVPRSALLGAADPPAAGSPADPAAEPTVISHSVFFTLADPTEANRDRLVAACREHLTGHEGVSYFAAGPRAAGFERDVNDTEYDVALLIVFESKAAHDLYQDHPRHQEFVGGNKALWKTVRVFDAEVEEEVK